MKSRSHQVLALLLLAASSVALSLPAFSAEGSFERTLKVTGPVELEVTTGSGNIALRAGDAASVRIQGIIRVHDRWRLSPEVTEKKIRYLEDNPPIAQTGNFIRVGRIDDPELRRYVSISYEISTPAETRLRSETGSGDQSIEGVRGPVKATTGSGNLKASGISDEARLDTGSGDIDLNSVRGTVFAETGSGNIRAVSIAGSVRAHTGSGDVHFEGTAAEPVRVETGSGNVEVSGVRGSLRASTGSGNITAQGEPTGDWKLDTGSGNIRMRLPAQAAFNLYAHTGSGSIRTNREITVQGKLNKHELRGRVGAGGSLVDVGTGSGDIDIE